MRNAIIAISSTLFGASFLILILALLIPVLRESSTGEEKSETGMHESSDSFKKIIMETEPRHSQNPTVTNDLQPAIGQIEGEEAQQQSKELHEPTLPVEAAGLPSATAPDQTAIDRNQEAFSAMQSPQPSITELKSEVTQQQSKGIGTPVQPDDASRLSFPNVANKTASDHGQNELNSRQSPAQTIIPQIDEKSAKPAETEKNNAPQRSPGPLRVLVLGEGLFPVGEGTPKANTQEAIDKIIPLIKKRSLDKVVVEGHADKWTEGGVNTVQLSKFNKIVSLRRASAVAKVLEQKGIARDRIIVKGLGDTAPLASNHTRAGRAKNRRVEIILLPTQ